MGRDTELLNAAIEALEDGRDPFSESFLVGNRVSFDEVMRLSEQMALGARLLLKLRADIARGGVYAQAAAMTLAEVSTDEPRRGGAQ